MAYILRGGYLQKLQDDAQSMMFMLCPFVGDNTVTNGRCGTHCPLFELQDNSGNPLMTDSQTAILHCAPNKREIKLTNTAAKG